VNLVLRLSIRYGESLGSFTRFDGKDGVPHLPPYGKPKADNAQRFALS
jgi:hypothetical protein